MKPRYHTVENSTEMTELDFQLSLDKWKFNASENTIVSQFVARAPHQCKQSHLLCGATDILLGSDSCRYENILRNGERSGLYTHFICRWMHPSTHADVPLVQRFPNIFEP
ncbi:hypothetical protein TNCV_923591 [Trichonephila clavipes]|nr:hypothetical protein TNCV_923591 [Trichonephila clavipes]